MHRRMQITDIACKNQSIRNFKDELSTACNFFANSSRRQNYFEYFISFYREDLQLNKNTTTKIIGQVKTTWVERHQAYDHLYLLYKPLVGTFESMFAQIR